MCGKKISYSRKSSYTIAELKNRKCLSCSHIGKTLSIESKNRISGLLKGRKFSNETLLKMSKSQTGKKKSLEYKKKMSLIGKLTQLTGEMSPNFGKKASEETRKKMSKSQKGRKVSDETKLKISKGNKGKILTNEHKEKISSTKTGQFHTTESKMKMRLSRIKEIESKFGQIIPNYNPIACQYFNNLMKINGCYIQHAENGGEFHINELGYWLDGYDAENNVAYEYDEKHHYDGMGKLKSKDIIKEMEIKSLLNCEFIRIKS